MPSSTSSSSVLGRPIAAARPAPSRLRAHVQPAVRLAGRLLRERTLWTLLLAMGLVSILAAGRPYTVQGLHPDRYWAQKLRWRHCADVLLAGDSRTYCGLSPAAMAPLLDGREVLNYGFDGNGWSQAYMDALGTVLKADPSGRRVLVLGISARSLTQRAVRANGYLDRVGQGGWRLEAWAPEVTHRLAPMAIEEFVAACLGRPRPAEAPMDLIHHRDGWIAAHPTIEDPLRHIEASRQALADSPVDPTITAQLLDYVRRWSAAGITVYGYCPPTTPVTAAMEAQTAGFSEDELARAFEQAGGAWLHLGDVHYHSYDGSHLRHDAAQQFSRDLAEQIGQAEGNR